MPVPKSIANHDMVLYSGFSSSRPSLIFPHGLNARMSENSTKNNATPKYSHEKLLFSPDISALAAALKDLCQIMLHSDNATVITAEIT